MAGRRRRRQQAAVLLDWLAAASRRPARSREHRRPVRPAIPDRRMSGRIEHVPRARRRARRLVHGKNLASLSTPAIRRPGREPAGRWRARLLASHFLGHKGIAILRAGQGDDAQGLFLRYGPSLNHGHCDELNINYIARGYDVTYDHGLRPERRHPDAVAGPGRPSATTWSLSMRPPARDRRDGRQPGALRRVAPGPGGRSILEQLLCEAGGLRLPPAGRAHRRR